MKTTSEPIRSISAIQLRDQLSKNEELLLVDVRESFEHDAFNIGGLNLPFSRLMDEYSAIPKNASVVLYCEKGFRSHLAIQRLHQKFGYNNLINLAGGMNAWRALPHQP